MKVTIKVNKVVKITKISKRFAYHSENRGNKISSGDVNDFLSKDKRYKKLVARHERLHARTKDGHLACCSGKWAEFRGSWDGRYRGAVKGNAGQREYLSSRLYQTLVVPNEKTNATCLMLFTWWI